MSAIDKAIASIESGDEGALFSYQKVAAKWHCNRSTLSQRHQDLTQSNGVKSTQQQLLNPQQELDFVQYIEGLTKRELLPTREMIQNFAACIAKKEVRIRWVSRFLHYQKDKLTTKWTARMERNRHQADSQKRYTMYFDFLHQKMQQYEIEPENTYNMDEKGFLIGTTSRSKRIFSRALWERKEVTSAIQDGSREWITVVATICADESLLLPAIIFEGKRTLQSAWVDNIEARKHGVFLSTSPSGWTNDALGLAWVEQVFNRHTKEKARRRW
jgi:hypothetical protein